VKVQSKLQAEDLVVETTDVTDETLKSLAKVIRSANQAHTLNINCPRYPLGTSQLYLNIDK